MKIGTRLTVITLALVMLTLGLYGTFSARARRAELLADLEDETALVGTAVQVAFEAAIQDGLFEDVSGLITRWQAKVPTIALAYIDLQHWRPGRTPPAFAVAESPDGGGAGAYVTPPPDDTRAGRLNRLMVDDAPVGEHITLDGKPWFALTVPIRDADRRIVAAIELTRDASDAAAALSESVRGVIYAVGGLGLMLGLLVWLSARGAISNPLKRLVEAIDDVTQGDLGRVILRERDDEVGALAERFNAMTASLREARAQILDGMDAKLALEARLRHSEKLATIGQLAAQIAHEVGTPLNVIGGRARSMEKKSDNPGEVAKNAGIIAAQTQRITKIIQQLLDFARRPAAERRPIDLQVVAKDTLDFLETQLAQSRVRATLQPFHSDGDGAPASPQVVADPDQMQQVALNLCLNAIQSMPDGGALELTTRAEVRRRPGLDAAAPGRYIVLEVADTGGGIPEADRERIFEPFYSTKRGGKEGGGTGLGLAVSVGIVKDHDGWIEIDSEVGTGSIFRVYVPASES